MLDLICLRSCDPSRRTVVYQQRGAHRGFTHLPVTSRRPGILRHDDVRNRTSLCGVTVSSALDVWEIEDEKFAEGFSTKGGESVAKVV